jgi:ABC-2 type transport system permease protein
MSTVAPGEDPRAGLKRDLGLVGWQIRYEQRAYWRNRGRGIFTFVFPIMFLVIFAAIDKGAHIKTRGNIPYDDFFVPGILAYAIIATTYVNMAISTAILRDEGVLKRMQGTPLPRWAYLAGRVGSTIVIVVSITAVTLGIGAGFYGVTVRAATLPGLLTMLVLGTAAFTTLGYAITRFIPNAESAPVVVNLTILPLTFVSSIWFPTDGMPKWLQHVANFFPIHPLADGLQYAFDPRTTGSGINGGDVKTLLIWAAVGAVMMFRVLNRPEGDNG